MAKYKGQGNSVLAESPAKELATASDFGGGFSVHGKDDAGSNLSRLSLYQGTAEEAAMYGDHPRGAFLDALEIRELGDKVKIMPVFAFARYSVWEQGQRIPVQTWDDQKDVPPDLLQWGEENGKRVPPKAQESVNLICCVEGEQWPYLVVFKRTGLKCFQRTINPLEGRRAAIGKCPGLYELSSIDDKDPNGKPYKRLTARPIGDPPEDMVALALKVFKAQQTVREKATGLSDEHQPSPDGELPE